MNKCCTVIFNYLFIITLSAAKANHHAYNDNNFGSLGNRNLVSTNEEKNEIYMSSNSNGDNLTTEQKKYLVDENHRRVSLQGSCHTPVPVCQRLTSNTRIFQPKCALLHRCAQDFGCCTDPSHQCMVKEYEEITLYFQSLKMSELRKIKPEIISQKYINHTLCACQKPKYNYPVLPMDSQKLSRSTCKCPYSFSVEYQKRSTCMCVCEHHFCKKYRNGRKAFTQNDVHYMKIGVYGIPKCRYGQFDEKLRKCPPRRSGRTFKKARP